MASILAMHAGRSDFGEKFHGANLEYEICPDNLDDNSLEADGNLNNEGPEQEHTHFMNLITRGYNSIQLSEKNSDIKVFHTSKGKQLVRAIRLFFKICCCILYVLQTFEFSDTSDFIPAYCKQLHVFLPFNPNPDHNSVLHAYQRGKCSEKFNYQLLPTDTFNDDLFLNNRSLLRFNSIAEMNNEVKAHFCSFKCNSTETCAEVTQNDFYQFCSCIVDCGGQLICNSAVHHEESYNRDIDDYDYSKLFFYSKPLFLYLIQAVFSLLVMIESIILCVWSYYNGVRWYKLIDGYVILDLVNGVLFLITLCFPPCLKDLFIPIFVQCLSAKIILNEIIYEIDTYSVQTKYMNVVTQKLISLLFGICSVLFFSVCLMHYLERTHSQSSIPNLFESLWFIIITITTVGYGDIYPATWYGKVFIMFLVILVLFSLTTVLDELLDLLGSSHKTTAAYFNYMKGKHVVLVTSNVRMNFLVDFLNELYSEENNDVVTVILCPRSPDKMTENRLKSPVWRRRVVLLQGSALRSMDLDRTSISNARCCFLIPDRQTDDPNAADQETILRAIAIRRFAPRIKLYVHILKPENRFQVDFATKIMCEGEIKHALFASNCICPGFSTFITLLLHTTTPDSEEKNQDYSYCSGNEIYDIRLGDSVLFSQYVNKNFLFAAVLVLRNSGVLLIGIQQDENKKILLNPGSDYILQENDICFYISQNREEMSRVVQKIPKYEAKNELEKMCAQVGLINMHYYNMDQTSPSKSIPDVSPIRKEASFNNELRRSSLLEGISLMQAAVGNKKIEEYNSDDDDISVNNDPKENQTIRDGITLMKASANKPKPNPFYRLESQVETSNAFQTSATEACAIPLQGSICPVSDSAFEEPSTSYDKSACMLVSDIPLESPEFQFTEHNEGDTEYVPEKWPAESENFRQFHNYSSCNYPRKKVTHGKKMTPESTGGGGLSKILRSQAQMNKATCEGPAKKKVVKPKSKLKARMSKLNLFDTTPNEPHTDGNFVIHDEKEQNELHLLEDNVSTRFEGRPGQEPTTKIKNIIGVPPVRPYVGSSRVNCHLISPATRQCCLQLGWKMQCHETANFKSTREQYRPEDPCIRKLYPFPNPNAIIVAADDAGPQLYHFILPLRSQYLPYAQLQPIVLLIPAIPEASFLEAISWLPQVYFIVGSAESVDDLLIAGILKANTVILCVGDGIQEEKDEIHMTDASRLNSVLKMRKVFPNTPFYVELFHRSNMRFLSPKIQVSHLHRRNPDDFLSTPHFKSGHVFSPSMLDTIIYQSAKKDYIIELVRLMLGLEQREGSAYLAKVEISQTEVSLYQNYGRIMQKFACDRKDLAIGVYRTEMQKHVSRSENLRYERVQEFLRFKLKELCIENVNIPPLPDRSKNSYVLVNPDASLTLDPNDVILVLRCNKFADAELPRRPSLMKAISFPQGISDTESDSDKEGAVKESALDKLRKSFIFRSREEPMKQRHCSTISESGLNEKGSEQSLQEKSFVSGEAANHRRRIFISSKNAPSFNKSSSAKGTSPRKFIDLSPLDDNMPIFNFKKNSYEPYKYHTCPLEVENPLTKSHSVNTLSHNQN
ncbi:Potassium channel subfamily member 1 isoform X21 [Oopsacas minuta]|uniref:Potassium channel subfamily member 1 isoform X21 n=1 Tax=Oopsacas minuta TaxID=111878 RepID=A0AAV7JXM4_9METZ|nr:Potassium channel subfamily member 1 isoform X21 [Oopsacas minuta]